MKKFASVLVVMLAALVFMGCKYELVLTDVDGNRAGKATVDTSSGVLAFLTLDSDAVDFTGYQFIMGDSVSEIVADDGLIMYKGPNSIYRVDFDSFVSYDEDDKDIEMKGIVITDLYTGEVVAEYGGFLGVKVED